MAGGLILISLAPWPRAAAQLPGIQFEEAGANMDVGHWTRTFGSYWTDFDSDGDPDFFLGRHQLSGWFLEKGPGGFRRLSDDDMNKFVDRHGCAWGQANVDRWPDLYCAQGADLGGGKGRNQLLIGGKEEFDDRARAFGVEDIFGRGRTVNWLDYDSDGDLDLFVGNFRRDDAPNVMFRNRRGRRFERVRVGVGQVMHTVSSSWADWDGDGDADLLIFKGAKPVAYENVRGQFERSPILSAFGRGWRGGAWADFDGDGWIDLHLMKKGRSLILRNVMGTFVATHEFDIHAGRSSSWFDVENDGDLDLFLVQGAREDGPNDGTLNRRDFILVNGSLGFEVFRGESIRGSRAGDGDSVAIADFDRDGSEDAFVTNGYLDRSGPNQLLANTTPAANWIGLDLKGTKRNPMAYGATIEVEAGSLSYSRPLTDGVGPRSQSEVGYAHLGLGSAPSASIEVHWPNGRRDCIAPAANQVVKLRLGSSPCSS